MALIGYDACFFDVPVNDQSARKTPNGFPALSRPLAERLAVQWLGGGAQLSLRLAWPARRNPPPRHAAGRARAAAPAAHRLRLRFPRRPDHRPGAVRRAVRLPRAGASRRTVAGGDFISGKAENLAALSAGLARCEPPLGKFGVYGNHDLWADDELMGRMLADAGVRMLVNRHVTLPAPFDAVSICGLDDPWAGAPDAGAAFAGAADVRVLLMHAPDGLLLLGGERFDLAFAGHTHGGQVAFRDGKPLILPQGPLGRSHYHGRYDTAGDGPLIVSRGIGCSTIPLRINADPELVICTIE